MLMQPCASLAPRSRCPGHAAGRSRAAHRAAPVTRCCSTPSTSAAAAAEGAAAEASAASAPLFAAVTPDRGFLPEREPLMRLPPGLQAYEDALSLLPDLALGDLRAELAALPPFDLQQLAPAGGGAAAGAWQRHLLRAPPPPDASTYTPPAEAHQRQHRHAGLQPPQPPQQQQQQQPGAGAGSEHAASAHALAHDAGLWRAYMVLSFLSHAYLWCGGPAPCATLPAVLARPWATVAAALRMPPVLVYATYNLMNWRLLRPGGGCELGNLAVQHQFLGGVDEAWFRLVHVAIEAAAAPSMAALQPLQQAAAQGDAAAMEGHLVVLVDGLRRMQGLLGRMQEHCDPYVYYTRVRAPMSGWRNNPALPDGLVYAGLWGGRPQQLYGETGAQSAIVPALDAVLGIQHQEGWLRKYLLDMRPHMPPSHRAFLAQLEAAGPCVRQAVLELSSSSSSSGSSSSGSDSDGTGGAGGAAAALRRRGGVAEAYDSAVHELEKFRAQHRGFAAQYIAHWAKREAAATGTGGSDFMPALSGFKHTTAAHRLERGAQ